MPDVLIFGDTVRSAELRHEVPVPIPDPFIYVERNGSRYVFVGSLEVPRIEELDALEVVAIEELGVDELIAQGAKRTELDPELLLRACRRIGVENAITPREFPLELGDYLRANGVSVRADKEAFDARRRVKTKPELEGVRRAQRSAEAAMDAIRARLLRGGGVSCEELRAEANRVFSDHGMIVPDMVIVSHGPQTAVGHEPGHGPIAQGEPIVADLYPRDPESGCFADMTRTFCLGEPPDELVRFHRLCREGLELAYGLLRPGATGQEVHRAVCELFQEHGFPTQLSKKPGEVLEDGFFHSLGHGVGLEVHEEPGLGRTGIDPLVAGDVLAVEPGLYRKGFGGCRLEDLVLVTDDGIEVLTDFPYDLAP
jgi:Xaa-Pro aminopeptidase